MYRATNRDKEALALEKRAERIRAIKRCVKPFQFVLVTASARFLFYSAAFKRQNTGRVAIGSAFFVGLNSVLKIAL
jgi:hypothetical protein